MTRLTLASVLLNSLWQGVLIAAVVQVAARMLPDGLAAYRYGLRWLGLVLLAVVAWAPVMRERPALAVDIGAVAPTLAPVRTYTNPIPRQPVALSMETSRTTPILPVVLLLMVCCAVVLSGRLVLSYVALEGTKRRARRVDAGVSCEGVGRKFVLAESDEVETPVLAGLWRPAVLLPAGFVERYPEGEVRAAILHEQAHLARWDDWTQLAQRLLDAVLFFHPGVRGLTWGMELDRELACDVAVLARTGDPQSYCQCLARLVGVAEPSAAPTLMTGRGRTIFKRMETIMNLREVHGRGRGMATLAVVAVIGAMLAAIGPMVVLQGTAPVLMAQDRVQAVPSSPARPASPAKASGKPSTTKASPSASVNEAATPSLDQAMSDLNRDMAAMELAMKASLRETDEALLSLEPALKAVAASLRSLQSDIAVQSLGTLTERQYRAAEAEYTETKRRYEEERRKDPEATLQRDIAQIERVGKDLGVPRAAIDAAIKGYMEDRKPTGKALETLFRNATQF